MNNPWTSPDKDSLPGTASPAVNGSAIRGRRDLLWKALRKAHDPVLGILGLLTILVLWQIAVVALSLPRYLVVAPTTVVERMLQAPDYFLTNSAATLYESILGFIGGLVLGILSALLIYYVPLARACLYPSMIAANTIPKVALAPLLVVWLGVGMEAKVVVALLIAFFPILVSTIDGLASLPDELKELAEVDHASTWVRFRKLDAVYALPMLFTGMKVSIALAVGGAVVGEFVAGNTGLGFVINTGTALLDTASMFAAFVLLSLMALVLFLMVELAQRAMIPWARQSHQ